MKNKEQEAECNLCDKNRKSFDGSVWYSGNIETLLCESCYSKWCKNENCKLVNLKYKKAKPLTKLWDKKCSELQKAFDKWFYANGGKDDKN